jgi:hypothetical protein
MDPELRKENYYSGISLVSFPCVGGLVPVCVLTSPFGSMRCLSPAFLTHNKANLCQNLDHSIGFGVNANFFAENWQK